MAKWKLIRQVFGNDEFRFSEGDEITVGRGIHNKIMLSSILVSRNHCLLNVKRNRVYITDLKSSNGIYVGSKKIPQNIPYTVKDSDIIGFGLTADSTFAHIDDEEKYIFKLIKEEESVIPSIQRIVFQNESDELEEKIAMLDNISANIKTESLPFVNNKPPLKRKLSEDNNVISKNSTVDNDIPFASNNEIELDERNNKKQKLTSNSDESSNLTTKDEIDVKIENELMELEAFNVKQEYLGYNEEPIQIDSESDSESENWYIRLSQNSPGKPFTKMITSNNREIIADSQLDDTSYSQIDDEISNNFVGNNSVVEDDEEDIITDLITIPPQPPDFTNYQDENQNDDINRHENISIIEEAEQKRETCKENTSQKKLSLLKDSIGGFTSKVIDNINKSPVLQASTAESCHDIKKTQLIGPLVQLPKKKTTQTAVEYKTKSSKKDKFKHKSSKRSITNSQREERKKKLKAIADKTREESESNENAIHASNINKSTVNIKVTNTNRGAFLTDDDIGYKPTKKRVSLCKTDKDTNNKINTTARNNCESVTKQLNENVEIKQSHTFKKKHSECIEKKLSESSEKKPSEYSEKKHSQFLNKKHSESLEKKKSKSFHEKQSESSKNKHDKRKSKDKDSKHKSNHNKTDKSNNISTESRVPLKGPPPTEDENLTSKKTISDIVEPLEKLQKPKKKVRFSEAQPEIHEFEIEPGNKMKKTSLVKATLLDVQHMPIFSSEKIALMKVLRWNPQWLEEQINNVHPPPILGHQNLPMSIFHTFNSHDQYVQLVGDLILMEIWESLSIGYMKIRKQSNELQMSISSLPLVPTQERCFEIFNISVDVSIKTSEIRNLPKVGEILLVTFGSGDMRSRRFFYVHNVRCMPSPPSNIHSFYNISLHATYTEKMKMLRPGQVITGMSLGFINNELNLFEAMSYLARSPLSEAILRPEPRHFINEHPPSQYLKSPWTTTLNESQQTAVTASVLAALSDRPCIQMVQGPPGTGKSSVICSIVMTYFYDEKGKRQHNRGKILICATSNAAVDGLVVRLLKIRQKLPKGDRFRMVRVGRLDAMHESARDVSSYVLAQRDVSRVHTDVANAAATEEISRLEAKINMWKTAAQEAKDPVRVAYCQGRITEIVKRIGLLSGGGSRNGRNDDVRPEQLMQAERRIIELADIIVTTLSSVHNHKLRGLKRRIALCIVDEAGQAIEPEALLPLTLDVTRLTLVGDPQQLPGYICSKRAKEHGLGESLFSRLSSCAEQWEGRAVVLLDHQYRMHAHIADYPSRAFYGARVRSVPPPRPPLPLLPYCVLGICSGDKGQQGSNGANEMEAWGVSRLVCAVSATLRRLALPLELAVITPYNAHKEVIRRNLRMLQESGDGASISAVEVNTVDSFQGQERDVVIVSLARSHGLGFVADAGRMNVLLTRAKHALFVCLNPLAVQKNPQWRTLLEDAQRRNLYRALPNEMCQAAGPMSNDDILKYVSN